MRKYVQIPALPLPSCVICQVWQVTNIFGFLVPQFQDQSMEFENFHYQPANCQAKFFNEWRFLSYPCLPKEQLFFLPVGSCYVFESGTGEKLFVLMFRPLPAQVGKEFQEAHPSQPGWLRPLDKNTQSVNKHLFYFFKNHIISK